MRPYVTEIANKLATKQATEHSYRPAVEALFRARGLDALNEPKRIQCGAPDFRISNGHLIGHIECKDVGESLDKIEKTPQLARYLGSLPNVLLTDHLEWRWYTEGLHRKTVRVASVVGGKVKADPSGGAELESLLDQFVAYQTAAPTTPRELARSLAAKAKSAREYISGALQEKDSTFHGMLSLFRRSLNATMTEPDFADVLAQTLTYGLFAKWAEGGEVPKAMPFLRALLKQILRSSEDDADANLADIMWVVENIEDLLTHTNIKVLDGFGVGTGMADPTLHFYEDFLNEYDPAARRAKGVWYTPAPVVEHIVEAVDRKLREDLGKSDGLADPSVHILDPACGTGTFLLAVLRKIHQTLGPKEFIRHVREGKIFERLYGFELMPASYAIAHLTVVRATRALGAEIPTGARVKVYLADTLADPEEDPELNALGMFGQLGAEMGREAAGAREVKASKPVVVVLGNPPYNGASQNKGAWITNLIRDYRVPEEKARNWLQDDYVKFWRFASWIVSRNGGQGGVVGFVTPHGWLDAPSFRGMRHHMLETFDRVDVVDLHGNGNKKERTPNHLVEGLGEDANVFDIRQGVAVTIAVRSTGGKRCERVRRADAWGAREAKFRMLNGLPSWESLSPIAPNFLLTPSSVDKGYDEGWDLKSIFPVNSVGVQSFRDDFVVGFTPAHCLGKMRLLVTDVTAATREFGLTDGRDWSIQEGRAALTSQGVREDQVQRIAYRPFDTRAIYWSSDVVNYLRRDVMRHLCHPETGNVALFSVRRTQCDSWQHILCGSAPAPAVGVEVREGAYGFPLYLLPDENGILADTTPTPNLSPAFVKAFTAATGLRFDPADPKTGGDDFVSKWTPLDLFHYIYGVLHDSSYRTKYAEFLKRDFPRIPVPTKGGLDQARIYRAAGEKLVALHLPDRWAAHPTLARQNLAVSDLEGGVTDIVEKVTRSEDGRVWVNSVQWFDGVTDMVWAARIGGYQPAQKWLKDRKGRQLTSEDILHYRRLCQVLSETSRIMGEFP